ncbi:hypothetical protein M5K25_014279 [Dendrobium thyrsiflorum]|uniref:Uncharacterized protein n=1 Tax=Dendrobium thyrsiflorum TaxID=117978 RepID=A0ABD0UV19_DENTH
MVFTRLKSVSLRQGGGTLMAVGFCRWQALPSFSAEFSCIVPVFVLIFLFSLGFKVLYRPSLMLNTLDDLQNSLRPCYVRKKAASKALDNSYQCSYPWNSSWNQSRNLGSKLEKGILEEARLASLFGGVRLKKKIRSRYCSVLLSTRTRYCSVPCAISILGTCAPPKGNFRRGATRTRRVRSHYPEGQNGRRPLRSSQAEEPMGRPVRSHIRSAIKGIGPHLHTSMDDNICNLNTVAGFPHPIHQLEWGNVVEREKSNSNEGAEEATRAKLCLTQSNEIEQQRRNREDIKQTFQAKWAKSNSQEWLEKRGGPSGSVQAYESKGGRDQGFGSSWVYLDQRDGERREIKDAIVAVDLRYLLALEYPVDVFINLSHLRLPFG